MIKTPLSTVIGGAFWTPKATILGGTSKTFDQLIKPLFANGEQGFAYDPNDLTTMFQDAAGTVPVTGVGQPVGLILDKSGRNNHASQTTSASRPILRQNAITKAYYLAFDGVDDSLKTDSINFTATDEISLFTGMYPANKGFQGLLHFNTNNANPQSFYLSVDSGRSLSFSANGSQVVTVLNTRGTDPSVYVAKSKISTQYILLKSNGVSQVGTGSLGTGNFGNYPLTLGARQDRIHLLQGDFYGLIGVGRLTTDSETATIEKELAKRTGVTLSV